MTNEIVEYLSKQKREEVIDSLRETAYSIQQGFETAGAPPGFKVYKVNLDSIRCMGWDPIGKWEMLPNSILRLTKSPCDLTIMFKDGWRQDFSFKEDDYRYIVGNWLVAYVKNKAVCRKA